MKETWTICSTEEIDELRNRSIKEFPLVEDPGDVSVTAEFFKALGDETRLRIIGLLMIQDMCLCEMTSALDAASSTITHHLKLLERGGVIESRKEGRFTVYHLKRPEMVRAMTDMVTERRNNHV